MYNKAPKVAESTISKIFVKPGKESELIVSDKRSHMYENKLSRRANLSVKIVGGELHYDFR